MGLCPLFQCSFCLQGVGPFGGPCVPWEAELWSPLRLRSMGKHPRSTCLTWRMAEVLGLVWLSLKGVCGLCFSALSACKGWGHVVAPVRPGSSFLTFLKQPGSLFGAFWHPFGRLGLPVATFQAHLAPESQKLENCAKNGSKMGAFLDPFWLPWAPLGSIGEPLEQKWRQKWPKVEIC